MLSRLSSFSGPLSNLFSAIKGFTLQGLILRYELKDTNSYSLSSTVTDLVGSSNATLLNGPTYSVNGYLNFDGTNDYLMTNTSLNSKLSPPNTSNVISVFLWVYPQDNGIFVTEQGSSTLNSAWHTSIIEMVSGQLKFSVWPLTFIITSSVTVSLFEWYYVGLTYDGSTLRAYVNGQQVGSAVFTRQTPNSVGQELHYAVAAYDFTDLGDETYAKMKLGAFHVYNAALSNQQVLNNYNYQKSNYIYTEDMLIWIDANDPQSFSGGTIFDISGNNYHHSLTSGATLSNIDGIRCFDCTDGDKRIVVNGTGPTLSTSGYTYVVWARLNSDNSLFRTLIYTKSLRYTPITIPDSTHPDANKLGYWDTNSRSSGYDISSLVGVWVQYSVVGDNSSQTFYINDYQVGSSISYGAGGTLHDGLGNNLGSSQSFGHVGNMMLYNKKLTLDEIKQNYDALKHVYTNGDFVTSNLNLCLLPSNASGANWTDSTGNLSVTMTGSPTYSSTGYTLNGTSQYGRIPSSAGITDFTIANNYTVEIWLNPSNGQSNPNEAEVLEKWNQNNQGRYPYVFRYNENTTSMNVAVYDGTTNPLSTVYRNIVTSGFTTNTWHQIVGVFNFTTDVMSVYKNGTLGSTVSLPVGLVNISNTSPVGIGHRISSNPGNPPEIMFKGSIGIIRMYNSALSASDVSKNFEANRGLYGI